MLRQKSMLSSGIRMPKCQAGPNGIDLSKLALVYWSLLVWQLSPGVDQIMVVLRSPVVGSKTQRHFTDLIDLDDLKIAANIVV